MFLRPSVFRTSKTPPRRGEPFPGPASPMGRPPSSALPPRRGDPLPGPATPTGRPLPHPSTSPGRRGASASATFFFGRRLPDTATPGTRRSATALCPARSPRLPLSPVRGGEAERVFPRGGRAAGRNPLSPVAGWQGERGSPRRGGAGSGVLPLGVMEGKRGQSHHPCRYHCSSCASRYSHSSTPAPVTQRKYSRAYDASH